MKLQDLLERIDKTPEFRRMLYINSLGVKNLHQELNRYNHSWGVCEIVQDLLLTLTPKLKAAGMYNEKLEEAVIIASLLHDIGHAPLSHSFERISSSKGKTKDHEDWTQEIILSDTNINKLLKDYSPDLPEQVADMLHPKGQKTFYHLLISSQFDADRLDYLQRDCLYEIKVKSSFNYDKLKKAMIPVKLQDGSCAIAFKKEAVDEVRNFFYSRFDSYKNNYISKEHAVSEYKAEASIAKAMKMEKYQNNPFVQFFKDENYNLKNYLNLKQNDIVELSKIFKDNMIASSISLDNENVDKGIADLEGRLSTGKYEYNHYSVDLSCRAYNPKKHPIYIQDEDGNLENLGDLFPDLEKIVFKNSFIVTYNPDKLNSRQIILDKMVKQR